MSDDLLLFGGNFDVRGQHALTFLLDDKKRNYQLRALHITLRSLIKKKTINLIRASKRTSSNYHS